MALGCCRTTSSARYRLEEKGSECPAPSRNPEVEARHEGTVESVYAGDSGVDRLKPNAVGLWGVIFVAVTGAAPISAMLFNVPFATGFGTGLYTPAAFLFATVILTIFSVGYVAMARKMRSAGGFYTFISHGLGRELGLATGITGALSYALFEVSLLGGFSYFAATNFNDWFGWEIPWIAFALFAAALISVLCYFDVELSVQRAGLRADRRGDHPRDLRPRRVRRRRQRCGRHPVRVAEHVPAHRPGPRARRRRRACSSRSGRGWASRPYRTTRRSRRTRRDRARGRR